MSLCCGVFTGVVTPRQIRTIPPTTPPPAHPRTANGRGEGGERGGEGRSEAIGWHLWILTRKRGGDGEWTEEGYSHQDTPALTTTTSAGPQQHCSQSAAFGASGKLSAPLMELMGPRKEGGREGVVTTIME